MNLFAILTISSGSFDKGFQVSLEVKNAQGENSKQEIRGFLPANTEILKYYQNWHDWYIGILHSCSRQWRNHGDEIEFYLPPITKGESAPLKECQDAAEELTEAMQEWLKNGCQEWQVICLGLVIALTEFSEKINLVIKVLHTDSEEITKILYKLPWDEWNLLAQYKHIDVALSQPSLPISQSLNLKPKSEGKPIKISHVQVRLLHILGGEDENLDLAKDHEIINEQVKPAEIISLTKPNHKKLAAILQDEKGWDILVFSGHSQDDLGVGKFTIRSGENAEVNDLKRSFKYAVEHGLKIVIFNSCVSLQLAQDLLQCGLAAVISMREEISDTIAHIFLEAFFKSYINGNSLYTSVKNTRTALESLEREYPGATWLPVISQNLSVSPPQWKDLYQVPNTSRSSLKRLPSFLTTTLAITALLLVVRPLEILEPITTLTQDLLISRQLIDKQPDQNILIVAISKDEVDTYEKNRCLNDTIVQLLKKLYKYNPKAIGLDIFFDRCPIDNNFLRFFKEKNNLIAVSTISDNERNREPIKPPDRVPPTQIGFADLEVDKDKIVRRQLLEANGYYAFSFLLALHYFTQENINIERTPKDEFKFDKIIIERLDTRNRGYSYLNGESNQILQNFRFNNPKIVTLTAVLNDQIDRNAIENKVILIGKTDTTESDEHQTPLGTMYGLVIHAQTVSQILSIVLNKQPQISVLPVWIESLSIYACCLLGGIIVWSFRSLYKALILTITMAFGLYLLCIYIMGTQAILIPLGWLIIALFVTEGILLVVRIRFEFQQFSQT